MNVLDDVIRQAAAPAIQQWFVPEYGRPLPQRKVVTMNKRWTYRGLPCDVSYEDSVGAGMHWYYSIYTPDGWEFDVGFYDSDLTLDEMITDVEHTIDGRYPLFLVERFGGKELTKNDFPEFVTLTQHCLKLDDDELAKVLRFTPRTVRRWKAGKSCPIAVYRWAVRMALIGKVKELLDAD